MGEFDHNPDVLDDELEAEWQSVLEDARDDPRDALPVLVDLVGRMLRAQDVPVDDPIAREGIDPDVRASWDNARETARLAVGGELSNHDLREALEELVELHDLLVPAAAKPQADGVDEPAMEQIELEQRAGDIGETNDDL
jgi:hypothetical protein